MKNLLRKILCFGTFLGAVALPAGNRMTVAKIDSVFPGKSLESVWTLSDAWKRKNSWREKICLNGCWQWLPDSSAFERNKVPAQTNPWCYFKVPGYWPGHGGIYSQKVAYDPKKTPPKPEDTFSAWYRRTVDIPAEWAGKKVLLELEQVDSEASVYVNGKHAGKVLFPGGGLEIGTFLICGGKNELSILVSVLESGTSAEFMAQDREFRQKKKVGRCGLTGDVFLSALPRNGFIAQVHFQTSVTKKELAFATEFRNLSAGRYQLSAEIMERGKIVKRFGPMPFESDGTQKQMHRTLRAAWADPKLWDTENPGNLYEGVLVLKNANGTVIDRTFPETFGFREFSIKGRQLLLNGIPVTLRASIGHSYENTAERVPAALSCEEFIYRNALRMKSEGWNFVPPPAAGRLQPGSLVYLKGLFGALSRAGVLTSCTLPIADEEYGWNLENKQKREKFLRIVKHLLRLVQNEPSIVLYVVGRNMGGYNGDQNPLLLKDDFRDPENPGPYGRIHMRKASLISAEAIRKLDPTRPVYHHAGGALGDLYTLNCYLGWTSRQERSEWFRLWSGQGKTPLFLVEYGPPHAGNYSSDRKLGGFIHLRETWQYMWLNEYNAMFLGEKAYRRSLWKEMSYKEHEKRLNSGRMVGMYPFRAVFDNEPDCVEVQDYFLPDNIRSMRAFGVSVLPWDAVRSLYQFDKTVPRIVWKEPGSLKSPGFRPDALSLRKDLNGGFKFRENSALKPQTAWIAGQKENFTGKRHNFRRGETVCKQIAHINDRLTEQTVNCMVEIPEIGFRLQKSIATPAGGRSFAPFEFRIPQTCSAKTLSLNAVFRFEDKSQQTDRFTIDLISEKPCVLSSVPGLFDPEKTAEKLFVKLKQPYRKVQSRNDLAGLRLLVIGRRGLADALKTLNLKQSLENGMRILVLEQDAQTLIRPGFRPNQFSIRRAFLHDGRVLHDWRGGSTLTPSVTAGPDDGSEYCKENWMGFTSDRSWKVSNLGQLCSVLLEKPSCGDFLPLLSLGFDLQYAGILQAPAGNGCVIFSQLDLCGRTEDDPEALELLKKMLTRLDRYSRPAHRRVFYSGASAGRKFLDECGIVYSPLEQQIPEHGILVACSGSPLGNLTDAVKKGLTVIGAGLSAQEIERFFPKMFQLKHAEYFSDSIKISGLPEFDGITNADLHWRNRIAFDGFVNNSLGPSLAVRQIGKGKIILTQMAPWMIRKEIDQFRTSYRRNHFLLSRLIYNQSPEREERFLNFFAPRSANALQILLTGKWLAKEDPENQGLKEGWWARAANETLGWRPVKAGKCFQEQLANLKNYHGRIWFRYEFSLNGLPVPQVGKTTFHFGVIDDESHIWVNGRFLGSITQKAPRYWMLPRTYSVEKSLLRSGKVSITILCNDLRGTGGLMGIPDLFSGPAVRFYPDEPIAEDDPYRYVRW